MNHPSEVEEEDGLWWGPGGLQHWGQAATCLGRGIGMEMLGLEGMMR